MKKISSIQNPLVKDILKLQEKSRERKKQQCFIVEGKRELSLAVKGGYEITSLLFLPEICELESLKNILDADVECIEISKEVYQKVAYRDSTEGVIALVKTKSLSLNDVQFTTENPLVIVAEGIEKPGNIGAILRTADAANVDAVFIANPKTDMYNPNTIRSSVGCLFTNQIAIGSSEDIITFLQNNNINMYSATLQNSNEYHKEDYTNASAIVVGTEATGLTQLWRDNSTHNINIPMSGQIDSMNVSVATAIVVFEAKRQRGF